VTNVNLLIQTATHSYIVLNTRTKQIELWLWKTMRNYFCDVNIKVTKADLDDILQTRRNVYGNRTPQNPVAALQLPHGGYGTGPPAHGSWTPQNPVAAQQLPHGRDGNFGF